MCNSPNCNHINANAMFRVDPTRTTALRQRFAAELVRRFNVIIKEIMRLVESENAFGLQTNAGRFQFDSDVQKTDAFMKWLREMQRKHILELGDGVPMQTIVDKAWTNKYIQSAYQKGIANAGARLRGGGARVSDKWMTEAFNRPIHADRVATIFLRTYRDLDGITKEMDRRISSTLALGLAEGRSPREVARLLRDQVEGIGITRARTLARTEIVAAHADANLTSFQEAGIEGVEVEAEWSTAADPCPICEDLAGKTYTLEEARGLLPAHPNCQCAWIPKVVNGSGIELR
jgi:SPP1 gp7 family putative phage head morphogenesis protein